MKILSVFCSTKVPVSIVASLLCLSLQHNLYAPQGPELLDTGGYDDGALLKFIIDPGNPGLDELGDWSIPTPDGFITPDDSILLSGSEGFLLSPTLIPLDELDFSGTGSESGNSWLIDPGDDLPGAGSFAEFGDHPAVSHGTWSTADNSNTMALLVFASLVLAVTVPRRNVVRAKS